MEADIGEQVDEFTNITETSVTPTEEEADSVNTSRGRGVRGRGKGGQMGRGARGVMMKAFGQPRRGRCRDRFMNGFGPTRMGVGRPRPYPDVRGRRAGQRGPTGMGPHPPPPPPPPPPLRFRGDHPHPPMHRCGLSPPPPAGHPGFRGFPLAPRRGMIPSCSPRQFCPRGYHSGPPPPRQPPGRGQRWPGPPGGRRF